MQKNNQEKLKCVCPYCRTTFKLTEDTFQHKGGIVRCGLCRRVFDANENMVVRFDKKMEPVLTNPGAKPDNAPLSENISGNREPLSDNRTQFFEQPVHESVANPFVDSEKSFADLSEQHLSESREPSLSPFYTDQHEQQLQYPDQPVGQDELEHELEHELGQGLVYEATNYEEDLHDEVNDKSSPELISGMAEQGVSTLSVDSMVDDVVHPPIRSRVNLGADQYINGRRNPVPSFIWILVTIAFLILSGLQVKYFFVEKFAQNKSYRGYLSVFCSLAFCDVPARKDPTKFTLTHTKIDLHPVQPGAVRVTVKIVNEADFAQPFPALQLTLTDRVGRVVGRRTFASEFYLPKNVKNMLGQGELASILFDLARPHEKAVGFVVDIVTENSTESNDL